MFVDHPTDSPSQLVTFGIMPMSRTRTASIRQLHMFFSYMRLNIFDSRNKIEAWKTQSERRQHRTIRNVPKFFSDSDPAHPEVLVIVKPAGSAPSSTRTREESFLIDGVEEDDIIVVQEVLPKSY